MSDSTYLSDQVWFSGKSMQRIIDDIGTLINNDLCIINSDGLQIAATKNSRIGVYNQAALLIFRNNLEKWVVENDYDVPNTRSGITFPLIVDGEIIGALGITGKPSEIELFGKLIQSLIQQQLIELRNEKERFRYEKMKSSFIYSWLLDHSTDDNDDFQIRGKSLRIDVTQPRILCLLSYSVQETPNQSVKDPDALKDLMLTEIEKIVHTVDPQNIITSLETYFVLMIRETHLAPVCKLAAKIKKTLESGFPIECSVGIGSVSKGSKQIRQSYQEARLACNVSEHSMDHLVKVFELLDLELLISIAPYAYKKKLFDNFFKNYPAEEIDTTIGMLKSYIKNNGSITRSAEDLHIHKNTMQYRLNKLAELTGHDARNIADMAFLYTIVLMNDLGVREA